MKNYIERLLNVLTSDPDDARRRRLLNILLIGILIASLLGLIAIVVNTAWDQHGVLDSETQILLGGIVVVTIGIFGIYQLNRRVSGRIAGLLFLLLLLFLFPFMDAPRQIVEGRSLFLFTLPIAIASLILLPQASFLFAVL